MSSLRWAPLALLLAAPLAALSGCADAVDPTLGTEQAFSLYGYLDPTADRQIIRVVPITPTLEGDSTGAVDAVLTSTEPATGRTAAWRDSLVTFADGTRGTLFLADYTPTAGTRVDLAVRAPDGREATASVEIPPLVQPVVDTPVEGAGLGAPVYPVRVPGVPRVLGGTLRLFVKGLPGAPGEVRALSVPLDRLAVTAESGTWTLAVPFLAAARRFLQAEGLANGSVELVEAEFTPFVANEAWAVPEGGFDEDEIVEPGTFSNVVGGFGFVGAGYRSPVRWVPAPGVQALAGFAVRNGPAGRIVVNEIGDGYIEFFNPTDEVIGLTDFIASQADLALGVRIPAPGLIGPGGFLAVSGPFAARAGSAAQLSTPDGALLATISVETDAAAWGAFPDGRSFKQPRSDPSSDFFYGPTAPTPGAPNRPASVPAVINEVSTSGAGYVEVLVVGELTRTPVLSSSPEGFLALMPTQAAGPRPFLVAREVGPLVLNQLGGEVYLLMGTQVVDVRTYGPQTPERASGYLPDGPGGAWTPGLRPTRGAPNAATRLGL